MKKRQKNKKNPYQNKTSHEFIRWGTLGPQIHKEASLPSDSDDRDFHIAPTKKGIYAFPKGYVETFLLGVSPENMIPGKRPNGRFFYLRDENGNKINREQYYDENYNPKPWISKLLKKRGLKEKQIDFCYIGEETDETYKDQDFIAVYSPKPKRFIYSGPFIWHHLKTYCKCEHPNWPSDRDSEYRDLVSPENIIEEKGSWIKTTMKVWLDALKKLNTIDR